MKTCKISGSISKKRRGHLDFCAVKCKNHGFASYLLGFSVDSILSIKYDLIILVELLTTPFVKAFVRWATVKGVTNRLLPNTGGRDPPLAQCGL